MVTKCLPGNSHPKKEQIMTFLDTLRIGLIKVASGDNNADIGTKRVPRALFDKLTDTIIDKSLRDVNHEVNKTVMFTNKNQYISPQIYDGTIN